MIDTSPYPLQPDDRVTSVESLLYFVWEREAIRLARLNGLPRESWTTDPVFGKYKFTNIRRRDDRVSQWVVRNLVQPLRRDRDLWFTLLVARIVNWPPTLEKLLYEEVIPCSPEAFNPREFERVIEQFKRESEKVYSGAYMIYPTKLEPGGSKSRSIARHIIGDVVKRAEDISYALWRKDCEPSVERFVGALAQAYGVSTFMAGQVAADLTYAPGHLDSAEDLYTWAPMGPGSLRGLNYLHGRSPYAGWAQVEFNSALQQLNSRIRDELQITDLTLHDVQNIMCEFSKYCRARLGEGKPKTIYNPETEF